MTLLPLLLSLSLQADPCGMVPPIAAGPDAVLQRDGAQRTYVMHAHGVETMVLRPGFIGDVEQFGMLIPFPTPPAIRKIDDDTFAHIEGAVEPPTVQVYGWIPRPSSAVRRGSTGSGFGGVQEEASLGYMEVNVVREEAVGMYQVAVLEAGSPRALEVWMDDNGYRYPEGMDEVVRDYVAERWCFVAVKAKVDGNQGATPRPGMRSADNRRPAGSSFDGHVQGMGFRFETPELVIPMRLSVFNGADPRNVVYLLTEQPSRLAGLDTGLVVRQLSGEDLHANLTQPLPQQLNGMERPITPEQQARIDAARDPDAVNGIARELFAADLLAARTGQLTLQHEGEEKEILNLSEALGMRGPEIDALHRQAMTEARSVAVDGALDDLKEMHLTVLDGVFDGGVLSAQNLRAEPWQMEGEQPARYDPIRPSVDPIYLY